MKTITALATARGISAIHIIRLSGADAYKIINKLSHVSVSREGNTIQHVQLYDENNNLIDDVLLMKFVAPKSFTGEDLIEINCHGSVLIADKIINSLIFNGAFMANNGEFSKRSLLNNKMNALQLFAMNNLIHSTNDLSIKYSLETLLNKKTKELNFYEDRLFRIIGRIEVLIDYPEFNDDNQEELTPKYLINFIDFLINIFENLIHDAKIIIPFYKGIDIAIVGVANAGKSSLLNKILNKEKAIVSDIAGTTRDIVEATINVDNRLWNLQDTAGIHKTNDYIESIGIQKSKNAIKNANFVLMIVDGSDDSHYQEEQDIFNLIKDKPHLIIINKSDLVIKSKWNGINISTKDDSYKKIINVISREMNNLKEEKLINDYTLQDQSQLKQAENILFNLIQVKNSLNNGHTFDLIIGDLHRILASFQELIGKTNDLDFIDRLFANFCVGK